jgi:hypothetical protein
MQGIAKAYKFVASVFGEHNQLLKDRSFNGMVEGRPASGSRIMPERKEDAAWVGFPGLTEIVGNRILNPLMKPFRV